MDHSLVAGVAGWVVPADAPPREQVRFGALGEENRRPHPEHDVGGQPRFFGQQGR
jgi:hypothetical protein